jgi:hypothetical protein
VQVDLVSLRDEIGNAFAKAKVTVNRPAELLAAPYHTNEDAYELATALNGKAWRDVPVLDLFRHRQMLFALTPEAYRAYLPAYLMAAIEADDKYGADIREYLLFSLTPGPAASPDLTSSTTARLAALDRAQRAAAWKVVAYLKERWGMRDADAALAALA